MVLGAVAAPALNTTGEQKLIPATAADNDEVGWAVALDGGIAVVGAPQDSSLASSAGAVHVYTLGTGGFVQTAKVTASDGVAGDELGNAVALDGDVLVAGAYHRWTPVPEPGRAYVFRWDGVAWNEEAKLTAPDGLPADAFGWAVALDGDWLAVGAPHAWTTSPSGGGAVYIYQRIDGVWTFDTKLSRGSDHAFGWSLTMDGNTLVVGSSLSPYERASVYVRDLSGTWNIQATIAPPEGAGEFGNAVALDDNNLVVGAWFDTTNGNYGAAFFYRRSGNSWTQVQKINSPGGELAEIFGEAVAIDGDLAVITDSGYDRDEEFVDMGAAYLYRRAGSSWAPAGKITPSDYATYTTYFGTGAALQGSRILIGAAYAWDDPTETTPGAFYAYEIARGSKLLIRNAAPDNEFKNKILFRGKGLAADVPLPGSPDDPTCGGGATASVEVSSSVSGESFVQMLPCANWTQTPYGYAYKDPERDDGPCRTVTFEPGRTTKVMCSGNGPSVLDFDLEPGQAQAPIGVKLTLGTKSFCTTFGGTIKADGSDGSMFKAAAAGGVEACN